MRACVVVVGSLDYASGMCVTFVGMAGVDRARGKKIKVYRDAGFDAYRRDLTRVNSQFGLRFLTDRSCVK